MTTLNDVGISSFSLGCIRRRSSWPLFLLEYFTSEAVSGRRVPGIFGRCCRTALICHGSPLTGRKLDNIGELHCYLLCPGVIGQSGRGALLIIRKKEHYSRERRAGAAEANWVLIASAQRARAGWQGFALIWKLQSHLADEKEMRKKREEKFCRDNKLWPKEKQVPSHQDMNLQKQKQNKNLWRSRDKTFSREKWSRPWSEDFDTVLGWSRVARQENKPARSVFFFFVFRWPVGTGGGSHQPTSGGILDDDKFR